MRTALTTLALALALAGCGSSGATTPQPTSPPASSTSAQPAAASTGAKQTHKRRAARKPQYGSTRVWLTDPNGHLLTNQMGPVLAPSVIRHLPDHGIVVYLGTQPSSDVLLNLDGTVIGHLIGNHLPNIPHLQEGWVGPRTGMGCSTPDARYRVCSFETKSWIIDTHTGAHLGTNWLTGLDGRFQRISASPDGRTLLAFWSGDCEEPEAVMLPTDGAPATSAEGGSDARTALESEPVGWMSDGRALINFLQPACGDSLPEPGLYTVAPPPSTPDPQLVYGYKNAEVFGASIW